MINKKFKFRFWCKSENRFVCDPWITANGNVCCMDGISGSDDCTNDIIVQQYSGCKDCFGTEIYDGDIIIYNNLGMNREGTVNFHSGAFFVDWPDQTDDMIGFLQTNGIKVVSNIFEYKK